MTLDSTRLGPLAVSRLGFGTLSISPLQSSFKVEQGAELLSYAWFQGVRFWDTAQIYDNYPILRAALKKLPQLPIIASKTYAYTAEAARAAVEEARRELGLDVLDIMLLHEQTALTLPGHLPALEWLANAKEAGLIKAIGVSTHSTACVRAAAALSCIDIIHPLYNKWGVGIIDGSPQDMAAAIASAKASGKGIYAMKVLGGGSMFRQAEEAILHVLDQPWLDSAVIGMSTVEEIEYNAALFSGKVPEFALSNKIGQRRRYLHIAQWCEGCGSCVQACGQGALVVANGKVEVNQELCVLCGYCSRKCEHMCLKIV